MTMAPIFYAERNHAVERAKAYAACSQRASGEERGLIDGLFGGGAADCEAAAAAAASDDLGEMTPFFYAFGVLLCYLVFGRLLQALFFSRDEESEESGAGGRRFQEAPGPAVGSGAVTGRLFTPPAVNRRSTSTRWTSTSARPSGSAREASRREPSPRGEAAPAAHCYSSSTRRRHGAHPSLAPREDAAEKAIPHPRRHCAPAVGRRRPLPPWGEHSHLAAAVTAAPTPCQVLRFPRSISCVRWSRVRLYRQQLAVATSVVTAALCTQYCFFLGVFAQEQQQVLQREHATDVRAYVKPIVTS